MPVLPREVLMDKQYIHTQGQNKKNKFKKKPPPNKEGGDRSYLNKKLKSNKCSCSNASQGIQLNHAIKVILVTYTAITDNHVIAGVGAARGASCQGN